MVTTKDDKSISATNNANSIISQSYKVLEIDKQAKAEGGYYSKYNTQASQTFGGAVGDGLIQGVTQALPETFKTDVQVLTDFRLGTFLRRKGIITGDEASLVDGVIDFLRTDKQSSAGLIVPKFTHSNKFIPIVLKTEFKLQDLKNGTGRDHFYIVFDSTPDNIALSKNATWNPRELYGRPEPLQIYQSSGAVSFNLKGMFFSDSPKDHLEKMKLEERLFALVTPSKNHFMPSPVEVRIGEWKRLRCIVNSVSIDYQGPWRTVSTVTGAKNENITLASHSPYMYDVSFSFTVVSEFNTVQYAEDILDVGFNGGYATSTQQTMTPASVMFDSESGEKYKNSTVNLGDGNSSIIYDIQGHAGEEGTIVNKTASFANTIEYMKDLGLPTDSNGASKLAGMAEITSGLTAIVETQINKKYGDKITRIFGK